MVNMIFFNLSRASALTITGVLAFLIFRSLYVVVYRLYFSPLARFPGPKLAALSTWYEAYYDLFKKPHGGQFAFHVKRLHEKYGPIVRVGPNEVHIDDPDYYNEVYSMASPSKPIDKLTRYKHRFAMLRPPSAPSTRSTTVFGEQPSRLFLRAPVLARWRAR